MKYLRALKSGRNGQLSLAHGTEAIEENYKQKRTVTSEYR